MLDDPRWLGPRHALRRARAVAAHLQDLTKVEPDALSFPYFDESLAEAMARETELLFEHLVKEDRSALELLTADYTFVNERLALLRHRRGQRPHVPQGQLSRRHAARRARPRQRAHAHLARQPHGRPCCAASG